MLLKCYLKIWDEDFIQAFEESLSDHFEGWSTLRVAAPSCLCAVPGGFPSSLPF